MAKHQKRTAIGADPRTLRRVIEDFAADGLKGNKQVNFMTDDVTVRSLQPGLASQAPLHLASFERAFAAMVSKLQTEALDNLSWRGRPALVADLPEIFPYEVGIRTKPWSWMKWKAHEYGMGVGLHQLAKRREKQRLTQLAGTRALHAQWRKYRGRNPPKHTWVYYLVHWQGVHTTRHFRALFGIQHHVSLLKFTTVIAEEYEAIRAGMSGNNDGATAHLLSKSQLATLGEDAAWPEVSQWGANWADNAQYDAPAVPRPPLAADELPHDEEALTTHGMKRARVEHAAGCLSVLVVMTEHLNVLRDGAAFGHTPVKAGERCSTHVAAKQHLIDVVAFLTHEIEHWYASVSDKLCRSLLQPIVEDVSDGTSKEKLRLYLGLRDDLKKMWPAEPVPKPQKTSFPALSRAQSAPRARPGDHMPRLELRSLAPSPLRVKKKQGGR